GMFRGNKEGYISVPPVKTKAFYSLIPSGGSYPVISSEDRKPFIILDRSNYGPVLVSAVSADESMSDFPENEIFAPVVLRSSVFLSYQGLANAKQRDIVNHDTLESSTEKADDAFLGGVFKNYGIKNYEVVEKNGLKNLENLVEDKRKGKSLWMYAAAIVLLLLFSEILLIRKVYGRKE
ncbi:MAG: hypothetical protein LWX07_09090, partial [Bacteroidetes bacterium]|nr:hypothetical protein [Bacteroidota bacterium]